MGRLLLFLFCWLIGNPLPGQESWCNTQVLDDALQSPSAYQRFREAVQEAEKNFPVHTRSVKYYPVVIHVVARPGYQMVTRAQALQQLDVLNRDFAGRGENLFRVPPAFRERIGSAGIQFCLATTDPEGNPTSGITFTQTNLSDIALRFGEEGRRIIHYDQLGGKTGWDPTRYINIWLGEFGTILGSAAFPGLSPHDEEIGLVINIDHFGVIGDGAYGHPYGRGHTLTHEMGHFFGLLHIWGEGTAEDCTDSDDIDDTPNAAGPHYHCPEGEQFSCGVSNLYQDFMDLTDDQCLAMFTKGQATRMEVVAGLYYPDMGADAPCTTAMTQFSSWYDGLTWATDAFAGKLILYHPDGFTGLISVRVFSMDGKRVSQVEQTDGWSVLLDLSRVGPGVYFVEIAHGAEKRTRKIVMY